jgi:predicted nucleic acid-binding protein
VLYVDTSVIVKLYFKEEYSRDTSIDLSKKHSATIGSRSLDILHVASALSINADRFLTFDDRQTRLAELAGLTIENVKQ